MKLLIVEDEENTRKLLRLILDWESLGIRIVGEAATGAEALDLMDELLPDIVLTDIEMPHMDGLTLSALIMERYSDVSVVVLTAHDQFRYARQALRSGVSNYLLKPLDRDVMEKSMRETVAQIRNRRALLGQMETTYKYFQSNLGLFRDRLLGELVHTGLSEGLESVLEMAGVRFGEDDRFTVAVINITNGDIKSSAAQTFFVLSNCRNYFEKSYEQNGKLYVFTEGLDNLVLLSLDWRSDLNGACRRLQDTISGTLPYRLIFGVSDPGHTVADLPRAYTQARDVLRLTIMGSNKPSDAAGLGDASPSPDTRTLDQRIPDLLLFIKSGLGEQAVTLAAALLHQAGAAVEKDLNAAKVFATGVLAHASEKLVEQGVPWMTLINQITPCYSQLLGRRTFFELEKLFVEQVSALCALTETHQQRQSSEIVSRAIQALEVRYNDPDLSLTSLARSFSVNSSYLSRIFKGHTGKPFSEYLLEKRIQKALDLMRQFDCKAYYLAEQVGIPDPNYFAKCFKKVTGMSFQAYKAEHPPKD